MGKNLTPWLEDAIDTLAASHAETGDFKTAIEWQAKALKLAGFWEKKKYRERLKLYESNQAFRDVPDPEPPD